MRPGEITSRRKVLFSATLVRGHILKFHTPFLKWFKEQGWETWVAAKDDLTDEECYIPYCDHFVNIDFARSPFSKQTFVAYNQLKELFSREHFDIVHTHTPVGGVLTRLAANRSRKEGTTVFYTAHGFHFFSGAPFMNWALWYPVEKAMSRKTDVMITINREDFERAKKFAKCEVEYIPGVGVDLSRFSGERSGGDVRKEFGIPEDSFLLLSVGDLIPRKNQGVIIEALALLPRNVELLICGEGREASSLDELAKRIAVDDRVHFAGFRKDIETVMTECDVLVFPSKHEGLPVSVMEAMASRLPVIASSIRGIDPDLLIDGESGLLLKSVDSEHIAEAVSRLMGSKETGNRLADKAKKDVQEFAIDAIVERMASLYKAKVMFDGQSA